jgi:hypothetical protein
MGVTQPINASAGLLLERMGRRGALTFVLVALCGVLALSAVPAMGRARTPRDAVLVVGIYIAGGPPPLPGQLPSPLQPQPGTVTVKTRTGKLVAKRTLRIHQTVSLTVTPGRYVASAVDPNLAIGGPPAAERCGPLTVLARAHRKTPVEITCNVP